MARNFALVGVIGLGTMGAGIVEVFARNGIEVVAVESSQAGVDKGRGVLRHSTDRAVSRGKLSGADQEALHARVRFTAELADLAECDLVIEAVPERLDLKRSIFARLDEIVKPDAVLATNTSSLSVTEISVATHNPRRVVGMHFFNPAPVLKFVEVIRTVVTEEAVVDDVKALAERLGKMPVVIGDKAGFIANALLFGYLNHAVSMFESRYATREDIDAAMQLGCGLPMGPLALMDLIGLDTAYEILDTMYKQGRDRLHAPSPVLKQMVTAGLKGRKTGKGFYTYDEPGSSRVVPDPLTPTGDAATGSIRPVGSVGVVGSGTMATGIVEVFARAGYDVTYVARSDSRVAAVGEALGRSLEKGVQRGKVSDQERTEALARVRGTTSLEQLATVDLVVEAVVEELSVKRALFENLDEICRPGAILATTTSSLPVIECAAATRRPAGRGRPALLQPRTGDEAGRGGAHRLHGRRRRVHRPGPLPPARQAPGDLWGPGRVHRQRPAVPLPQRRRADGRGELRRRGRHRHRDEDRLRLPDGPVRAARRRGARRGARDPA